MDVGRALLAVDADPQESSFTSRNFGHANTDCFGQTISVAGHAVENYVHLSHAEIP